LLVKSRNREHQQASVAPSKNTLDIEAAVWPLFVWYPVYMKAVPLVTSDPLLRLVEPDIERDAALGVKWLAGNNGRNTLRLMGVNDADNKPSSLEKEKARVNGFITKQDQLNWMMEYDGKIVGSI
jgi:hypothetical protein